MTPNVAILRTSKNAEGTFGVMFDGNGEEFAVITEGVSKLPGSLGQIVIPTGHSVCKKTKYNKGNYPTFEIIVTGHSRILFHKGNFKRDSTACVVIAEKFSIIGKERGIGESQEGFDEFWKKYKGFDTINLYVYEFDGLFKGVRND